MPCLLPFQENSWGSRTCVLSVCSACIHLWASSQMSAATSSPLLLWSAPSRKLLQWSLHPLRFPRYRGTETHKINNLSACVLVSDSITILCWKRSFEAILSESKAWAIFQCCGRPLGSSDDMRPDVWEHCEWASAEPSLLELCRAGAMSMHCMNLFSSRRHCVSRRSEQSERTQHIFLRMAATNVFRVFSSFSMF